MRINHNIASLNTYRQLASNNTNAQRSLEKLSSGYRINRAGDDAAGLAISEKMRAQIRGLGMASKNSQDAISLIQTAEGAMSETHSILQRMRELAVQASSDTNVSVDRDKIQQEMNQLSSEINRIGNTTEFNTMKLLNSDRAITYSSSTSTQDVVVSGSITFQYANGVSGTLGNSITGGVTIAAGEFLSAVTSVTGTIVLTMSTGGTLHVTLSGSAAATNTISAIETVAANADGSYSYDNHGVSFTISATEASALSGSSATMTLSNVITTAAASYDTESNYNISGTSTSSMTDVLSSGITIGSDVDQRIRTIEFGINSDTFSANITVTLKDSAGTSIFTDEFMISGQSSMTYSNHGITFSLDAGNALSSGETISASFSITGNSLLQVSSTTTTSVATDNSVKFQVGANQNQSMALDINDMRADALDITSTTAGSASLTIDGASVTAYYVSTLNVTNGTSSTASEYALDISTSTKAAAAVTVLNDAINTVSEERSKLGAVQNRLEHTIANLDTSAENLQASESRIRDVDMAKEMMEFTKNNILMQAGQAMLAQANQQPQGVLQLLR